MRAVRESLRLKLVGELAELVEIDTGSEPERVRNRPGRTTTPAHGCLAQSRPDGPVDRLPERDAELARPPLQETRKIVVECERRSHVRHHRC
jgi:hypothetical protein